MTVIELGWAHVPSTCLLLEQHHICWGKGYRILAQNTTCSRNTYHKWDLDFFPCLNFSSYKFSKWTSPIMMNTSYDKEKAGVCFSAGSATGFNFQWQYNCNYQHLAWEVEALSLERWRGPSGCLRSWASRALGRCVENAVECDLQHVRVYSKGTWSAQRVGQSPTLHVPPSNAATFHRRL